MVRIAARRIVATVQNEKTARDWSASQFPRNSVCSEHGAMESEVSIALQAAGPSPRPAFIGSANIDLRPESFADRLFGSHKSLRSFVVRGRLGYTPLTGSASF